MAEIDTSLRRRILRLEKIAGELIREIQELKTMLPEHEPEDHNRFIPDIEKGLRGLIDGRPKRKI